MKTIKSIMSILRKYCQTVAIVLLITFFVNLFIGCKTLESSTALTTVIVPGTDIKTGKKEYSYETLKEPTIEDPTIKLKLQQSEQYKVKTKTKYQDKYNVSKFGKVWGITCISIGVPGVMLGFADFGNYLTHGHFSWEVDPRIHLITPLILIGGIRAIHLANNGKTKYKYINDFEFKYTNPLPLENLPVNVLYQGKSTSKISDIKGYLTFNPVQDFDLTHSTNNDLLSFGLKTSIHDFGTLYLEPSLWMNKYSRINVPECDIWPSINHINTGIKLGTARKNMEYKILREDQGRFEIELYNKTGWISNYCANTFYSVPKKHDVFIAIQSYVEDKANIWLKQGEFESSQDYLDRMQTRDEKLKTLTEEAMELFQHDYERLIDWKNSQISRYDPNSQTFKIDIPDLHEIILSVPIHIAKSFKENWTDVEFNNPEFILVDGEWELSSLELKNKTVNYTAKYDSKISKVYDPTNQFAFKLDPISINVSQEKSSSENYTDIDDNYSINTNLPVTNESNPDAIAVVIGNSNYLHTDPVNFAINDAQLMKVYLINVLGFKPGNIIFIKNATKADFEGIFGTKENYQLCKLNQYVKPNISDVFIFYSGHGAPGINDQKGYFVPVDCDPLRVELQGYQEDLFYKNLALIPAKTTIVILDACFSGAGVLKNISSIRIKPLPISEQINNSAIMTSSQGNEVSSWYNAKQHGLFTYFFLKAVHDNKNSDKDNDGNLTIKEIYEYVSDKTEGVPYYAGRLNGVQQNPTIQGTDENRVLIKTK